jgi:hypothetical protein
MPAKTANQDGGCRPGHPAGLFAVAFVLDSFQAVGYRRLMPDASHLRPATPDEIADALSFALRYQGR